MCVTLRRTVRIRFTSSEDGATLIVTIYGVSRSCITTEDSLLIMYFYLRRHPYVNLISCHDRSMSNLEFIDIMNTHTHARVCVIYRQAVYDNYSSNALVYTFEFLFAM